MVDVAADSMQKTGVTVPKAKVCDPSAGPGGTDVRAKDPRWVKPHTARDGP